MQTLLAERYSKTGVLISCVALEHPTQLAILMARAAKQGHWLVLKHVTTLLAITAFTQAMQEMEPAIREQVEKLDIRVAFDKEDIE